MGKRLIITKWTYLITILTMRVSLALHETNCAISEGERELMRKHFKKKRHAVFSRTNSYLSMIYQSIYNTLMNVLLHWEIIEQVLLKAILLGLGPTPVQQVNIQVLYGRQAPR